MASTISTVRVLNLLLLTAGLFLAVPGAEAQLDQDEASSAIMGRQSFRSYCASCHGAEARGDGSVAEHLNVPPADLTQISKRNGGEFPAEQVYETIDGRKPARGHGNRDMPIWGNAFKATRDNPDEEGVKKKITDLVSFLKSIQED